VTAVAIAVGVALPAAAPFLNQTSEIQMELEEFISNAAGCKATAMAVLAVAAIAVRAADPQYPPLNLLQFKKLKSSNKFISTGGLFDTLTPVNNLPIPVPGENLPDDGCGDSSVRFQDGRCYSVLKSGSCRNSYYYITVDPLRLTVSYTE